MTLNKLLRKGAAVITAFCILLGTSQFSAWNEAYADETVAVAALAGEASVYSGNSLDVTLKISGVTDSVYRDVYGLESTVSFDPDQFELLSVQPRGNDDIQVEQKKISAGEIRITANTKDSNQGTNANRSFAALKFKAKAVTKDTNAVISLKEARITNGQGERFNFTKAEAHQVLLQPAKVAIGPGEVIPDGEYPIGFTILKDNSNEVSMMNGYTDQSSGKLTAAGGKYTVSFTLKQSKEITGFKIEQNGQLTTPKVINEDTANNTRTVRFDVKDPSSKLNGWVKIYWDMTEAMGFPFIYDEEYNVDLTFDITGVPVQQPDTSEPTPVTPPVVTPPVVTPDPAGTIPDGEYPIGFTILKDNSNEVSMMNGYTDQSSGKLTAAGGKYTVSFTLKQSKEITGFKVEQNGQLTTPEVINDDTANNTRTVRFDVKDPSSKLNGWVKIYWDMTETMGFPFIYDEEYNVDLAFDTTGVPVEQPGTTNPGPVDPTVPVTPGPTPVTPTPVPGGGVTTPPVQNGDGTYSIKFGVFYPDGIKQSRMASYMANPATLVKEGSNNRIMITVKESSSITGFKVKLDGSYDDVSTLSEDSGQNTRVISLDVKDLSQPIKAKVKVEIPTINYYGDYEVLIVLYPNSIKIGAPDSYVGDAGSLVSLLADGDYALPFQVKDSAGKEASAVSTKFVTPASLTVKSGKNQVSLTVRDSKSVTRLEVDSGESYKALSASSTNEKQNTRVVQFNVKDLTRPVYANVNISGKDYKLQLVFDVGSIEKGLPKPYVEPPAVAEPALADGDYTVNYSITTENKIASYFGSGAELMVKNGKVYAQLKLNNSSSVATFEIDQDGTYATAQTVRSDEVANTRVVGFEPNSLVKPLKARLHIQAPKTNAVDVTTSVAHQFPLFLSTRSTDGKQMDTNAIPDVITDVQADAAQTNIETDEIVPDGVYDLEIAFDTKSIAVVVPAAALSGSKDHNSSTDAAVTEDSTKRSADSTLVRADKGSVTSAPGISVKDKQPDFDRNADMNDKVTGNNKDELVPAGASERYGFNPTTGDSAPFVIYALLLAGSAWMLIRYRRTSRK